MPLGPARTLSRSYSANGRTYDSAQLVTRPPSSSAWQKIAAEPTGLVLINRYRVTPIASVSIDSATGEVDAGSVMGGRVRGTRIVYARTGIIHRARLDAVSHDEFPRD
jgi:hypothetical protein